MDKFAKQAVEKFINIIKTDEHKHQIEHNVLDPMVDYIGKRLWPYIVSLSISLCLLLIVIGYIMYFMIHLQKDIRLRDLKQ